MKISIPCGGNGRKIIVVQDTKTTFRRLEIVNQKS